MTGSRHVLIGQALFLGVLGTVLVGCGSSGPPTYPVAGKVEFRDKGGKLQELVGGKVRLQSTTDSSLMAVGEIDEEGAFTLGAFLKEQGLPGVPAGQYKARIEPPKEDDRGTVRRGIINPKYQDFDKSGLTVQVPVSGPVVFQVERPR